MKLLNLVVDSGCCFFWFDEAIYYYVFAEKVPTALSRSLRISTLSAPPIDTIPLALVSTMSAPSL